MCVCVCMHEVPQPGLDWLSEGFFYWQSYVERAQRVARGCIDIILLFQDASATLKCCRLCALRVYMCPIACLCMCVCWGGGGALVYTRTQTPVYVTNVHCRCQPYERKQSKPKQ